MRTRLWLVIIVMLPTFLPAPCGAMDSVGREFFFAFQSNYFQPPQYLRLYVASQNGALGRVRIAHLGFDRTIQVAPGGLSQLDLPLTVRDLADNGISKLGVEVRLDGDATVYGINRANNTTDAFLALPTDALGRHYRVLTYRSASGKSQVAVVGTVDGTKVRIRTSAPVRSLTPGQQIMLTLDAGDVYSLVGATTTVDLTGTLIEADAPVAVMAGAKCANVPASHGACDHLAEMMPPLSTWGKRFVTMPLATRKKGDLIRVLADRPDSHIRFNGEQVAVLQPGEVYESIRVQPLLIESDQPVLVSQYSLGTQYDHVVSDPFMVIVPPTEQFLDNYVFATPETGFHANFVTIVALSQSIATTRLDGQRLDRDTFRIIGESEFSGAAIALDAGIHRLEAEEPFGITLYGFDQTDSYGYPGGMAFARINPIGDGWPPSIVQVQVGDGRAILRMTDSEDTNADGQLGEGEDLDGDGHIGPRNEDRNGNARLDPGEDRNQDGIIDRDTGLVAFRLSDDVENLRIEGEQPPNGASSHLIALVLIDPDQPGKAHVMVEDASGNQAQLDVQIKASASARLGEQRALILGDLPENSQRIIDLAPNFTQRDGRPRVQVSTDLNGTGARLELDHGDGWQRIDNAPTTVVYDPDRGPWAVRLRTGRCINAVEQGQFHLLLETRAEDGSISRAQVPLNLHLEPTPLWRCLLPFLVLAALVLALAFILYGFIRPSRFPTRLGVMMANEEDIEDGFFLLLRAQKGASIGFYRDARVYVREDYRVCGNPRGAIVRLRADHGRILIQPVGGTSVTWQNAEGDWEPLPDHEIGAALGNLYRNQRETVFFSLRNR
ncbi:MAG TPA: hypothetical protein DDY14_03080 [Chromatiaceae bacterium]|jgi:hypothetical protein|nr:hypothetical protein [Chromatiaceae bacterium]